jgi:hypothetical protein
MKYQEQLISYTGMQVIIHNYINFVRVPYRVDANSGEKQSKLTWLIHRILK